MPSILRSSLRFRIPPGKGSVGTGQQRLVGTQVPPRAPPLRGQHPSTRVLRISERWEIHQGRGLDAGRGGRAVGQGRAGLGWPGSMCQLPPTLPLSHSPTHPHPHRDPRVHVPRGLLSARVPPKPPLPRTGSFRHSFASPEAPPSPPQHLPELWGTHEIPTRVTLEPSPEWEQFSCTSHTLRYI